MLAARRSQVALSFVSLHACFTKQTSRNGQQSSAAPVHRLALKASSGFRAPRREGEPWSAQSLPRPFVEPEMLAPRSDSDRPHGVLRAGGRGTPDGYRKAGGRFMLLVGLAARLAPWREGWRDVRVQSTHSDVDIRQMYYCTGRDAMPAWREHSSVCECVGPVSAGRLSGGPSAWTP